MAKIIKINEKDNNLMFESEVKPIVCGNSNYCLNFNFTNEWNECENKTLMLVLNGNKILIEFAGDEVMLPPFPNSRHVDISVFAIKNRIYKLSTTMLRLELFPVPVAEEIKDIECLGNYVQDVIGSINELKNGDVKAKFAETADRAMNVSNPNLLINGDFKVNQRGTTTYTEAGKYTVDRWKLLSGSLEVVGEGIKLNGTIVQKLEHAPTGDVVCSVDTNGGNATISYLNGVVTITTTSATLIKWAKLEVGTTATIFSPRTYAEELALCQRYYVKIYSDATPTKYASYISSSSSHKITIILPVSLRTRPTISFSGSFVLFHGNFTADVSYTSTTNTRFNNNLVCCDAVPSCEAISGQIGDLRNNENSTSFITIDAEIY